MADTRNRTCSRQRATLLKVGPEQVFDLDPDPQVMAAITQAGQELVLPNQRLGSEEPQLGLGSLGIRSAGRS